MAKLRVRDTALCASISFRKSKKWGEWKGRQESISSFEGLSFQIVCQMRFVGIPSELGACTSREGVGAVYSDRGRVRKVNECSRYEGGSSGGGKCNRGFEKVE